ncbi:MAG: response regulator [Magnetococcales bacterium]|nr:response regulator [Magnetococcales bacterium]
MHHARREILIKFIFIVALLVLAGSAGIHWQLTTYNEQRLQESAGDIRYTLDLVMQQQSMQMQLVLSTLQQQENLHHAFLQGDRHALLQLSKPLFEAWQKSDAITHLYFHSPDGHNLLRVHQPERFADRIERHTLQQAMQHHSFFAGLELGPLGTLTLRAVQPWYDGKQLLGFVEMGKELYLLTSIVQHQFHVDLYLFISKQYVTPSEWRANRLSQHRSHEWDQFAHHLLIGQSNPAVPAFLHTLESDLSHSGEKAWYNLSKGEDHYNLARLPIVDSRNREIGFIAVVQDITPDIHRSQQMIAVAVAIGLLGGTWLVMLLGGLLDQWENRWHTTHGELQERETRLRLTQATTHDAIITIDAFGIIQECNPAAESLFGYRQRTLLKQNIADCIIPPDLRTAYRQAMHRQAADSQTAQTASFRRKLALPGLHADGHTIDLAIELIGLSLAGKRHFTAFLRDVTDRKQLLRSLDETLTAAESANRMKSEFLANMSHEIRTPMNGIIGMTDLLLTMPLSPEEQRCNLEIILQSSLTLLGLINNILDYSKFDAGMVTLERVPFDLSGQLETVCNTLAIKAHQQGLALHCRLHPDLPVTLSGDPLRLRQVLLNLVNNAIKFTADGEVTLSVAPCPAPEGAAPNQEAQWLRFTVRDSGIGIAAEKIPTLFERFSQVDGSTTRQYGGTGLGLAISKHLVSLMGGEITVASQPGQGSTFSFTAAFAVAQRQRSLADGTFREERRNQPLPASCRHLRFLLADRNRTGRDIVKEILQQAGGEVVEACDPASLLQQQAIAQEQEQPFDFLLLDHNLLQGALRQPDAPHCWQGAADRILLLLPAHITLESVQTISWLQQAKALRKPLFKFRLLQSIQHIVEGQDDKPAPSAVSSALPRQGPPLRILLVEDHGNNQKLAQAILHQVGHQVLLANHGREALHILANQPVDLLLMDLQMPEMDGFTTTRHIRQADSGQPYSAHLPIIAVTAKSADEEEQHCLAVGMNGYLKKPYRSQELLSTIDAVMQQHRRALRNPASCGPVILQDTGLPAETLVELSDPLLTKLPQALEGLTAAIAAENLLQVDKWVSWLSEAARAVGAKPLTLQVMRLRSCAEQKQWAGAQEALAKLLLCCQKTSQALQQRKEEP